MESSNHSRRTRLASTRGISRDRDPNKFKHSSAWITTSEIDVDAAIVHQEDIQEANRAPRIPPPLPPKSPGLRPKNVPLVPPPVPPKTPDVIKVAKEKQKSIEPAAKAKENVPISHQDAGPMGEAAAAVATNAANAPNATNAANAANAAVDGHGRGPPEKSSPSPKPGHSAWGHQYLSVAALGTPVTHPLAQLAPQLRRRSHAIGNLISRRKSYFTTHQDQQGHGDEALAKSLPRSKTAESLSKPQQRKSHTSALLSSINTSLAYTEGVLSPEGPVAVSSPSSIEAEERRLQHDLEELTQKQEKLSQALEALRRSKQFENASTEQSDGEHEETEDQCAEVKISKELTPSSIGDRSAEDGSIPLSPATVASDDVGYLSDPDLLNLSQVRARFKDFIDSFGKGTKQRKKSRPIVETPWIPKTPPDDSMNSLGSPGLLQRNHVRQSVISGSSSSSNESSNSMLFDSNENEVLLSPEEKQARKVFKIAEEMMTSEREFVNVLRLINVDFKEHVEAGLREYCKSPDIIPEEDFHKLFVNLLELQILNADLLKDFETRIVNWKDNPKIADVIVQKGAFLKLYTSYIERFPEMSALFMESCEKYPIFGRLVREFELLEKCQRLKISHYMLKPVQRLPQYRLLLEQYLKNLSPASEDYSNAIKALDIVTKAAEHANEKMKQMDNFKRLLTLQNRLGVCDLVQHHRELLKEGALHKISRSGVDLRYIILCNDCLIYAKFTTNGSLAAQNSPLNLRYKIPLTHLSVVPQGDEFPLDFNVRSSVRSCGLRASTVAEREDWIQAINAAVERHRERKATFSKAALGETDAPQKLGESAPVWVPDERVTMCQKCHYDFNFLVRRHHCRACGQVVCYYCSGNKAPLKYRGYEPSRVCDTCFDILFQMIEEDSNLRSYESRFRRDENKAKLSHKNVPPRLRVRANDEGAQLSGYLHKKAKSGRWKKHWFVLKERVLYEYKACEDSVACATYPILGYDLILDEESCPELLGLYHEGKSFRLTHVGSEPLLFFAELDTTATKWESALLEAVSFDS